MKRYIYAMAMIIMLGAMVNVGWGQTTVSWNFGTSTGNASPSSGTPISNLTISDISIGNTNGTVTMLSTTSASSGYTGASGQYNAGNAARTGALNTGASGSAYFEFTLTPALGYIVTLSTISFGTRSTSTAPQAYTLRYSKDSYGSDLASGTISANSTWELKSNSSLSITSNTGSAITCRIYGYNGTGSPTTSKINWRIDDLSVTLSVNTENSPTISTSLSSLSGFTYIEGSGPSSEQTFTVSGSNLTSDISITAPTNYEISKTSGSGYTSPLTLTQSGGTVSETTIYVRLKAGLSVGSYSSENIVCSSTGAVEKNVTCSGTVYKTEPSNHVTSFTAVKDGTYGYNRIDLSWTEYDGSVVPDGYLIKASTADNITNPSDGTAVSDNTTIGSNSGAVNISHGTTSYEWTGLTPEQTYYFKIFTYTNSGTNINYKTDGTIPSANATTDAAPVLPKVIITEVADHSTYQSEYVEIYNADNLAVNIDGWVLRERYAADNTSSRYITLNSANQKNTGGSDYLTLSPGEYAISLRSTDYASFKSTYSIGDNVAIFQNSTTAVPQINGNERYQLENVGGDVIDSFGDWDRAPIFEVTQNYCYERINGSSSNGELSSNWISTVNSSYNYTPAKVNDTSLPVSLTFFTAQPTGNAVSLTWVTESEIENQGFNLYRKLFGGEYALLSSFLDNSALVGQGTTTQKHIYTFTDHAVQPGATYVYQLADVDYAGKETKHKDVEVKVEAKSKGLVGDYRLQKAYPNPFNASFTIPLELGVSLPVDVRLYDVSGACVRTIRNEILSAGTYHLTTDTRDLTSGIYLLRMRVGNRTETQKIVLMK